MLLPLAGLALGALGALSALGCVRMAVPLPARLPLLAQPADTQLALNAGFHGTELAFTRAVDPHWDADVSLSGNLLVAEPYGSLGLGAAYRFGTARPPTPLSAPREVPWQLGFGAHVFVGTVFKRAERFGALHLQADAGARWRYGALGLVVRTAYVHMEHGIARPSYAPRADGVFLEPTVVARLGAGVLHAEMQLGASMPLWIRHDLGAQWPATAVVGVCYEP